MLNIQKPARLRSINDLVEGVRLSGGRIGIERNVFSRESVYVADIDTAGFFANVLIGRTAVLGNRHRCGGGVVVMSEGRSRLSLRLSFDDELGVTFGLLWV